MPIIPTGYLSVDLLMTFLADAEPMEVTFWCLISEAASAEMADDIDEAWWTTLGDVLTNDMQSGGVRLQDSEGGVVELPGSGRGGSGTGQPYPPNVAVLVQKRSGIAGRANQGRFFVPGFANDQDTGAGVIDGANLLALQSAADDFLSALEGIDGIDSMVIGHADVAGDPGPTPTPVTSLRVSNRLATQRQRLRP